MLVNLFHLLRFKIFKKKIKKNPYLGYKDTEGTYEYREGPYSLKYRIVKGDNGQEKVEWIYLKRRLNRYEISRRKVDRSLFRFRHYQKWMILFKPSILLVLFTSAVIFYFGLAQPHNARIAQFKWIASQITGINPESIEYTGEGRFRISGRRETLNRALDPITISFNPIGWLFFSDTFNINRWNTKLNKYNTYSVTFSDKGDVWLQKKKGQFHGQTLGNEIIWDRPPDTLQKVFGNDVIVKDGKLKFFDE